MQTLLGFYYSGNKMLAKQYTADIESPSVVALSVGGLYPVFKGPWEEVIHMLAFIMLSYL